MPVVEPVPLSPEPGGLPPNVAALLACAFPLIGGIVFLFFSRKSPFVRFYAMQSILFGCAWFAITVILRTTKDVLFETPLLGNLLAWGFSNLAGIIKLIIIGIYVVQIWKAFSGKEWEIPYLGRMARRQLSNR